MDKPLSDLDWSLLQSFLAVAETGSLSAAARALGLSQPTLGRKVREVEAALGAELFHRHAKGPALTETGQAMLGPAQAMRDAAGRISLVAAGEDRGLSGPVRITASVVVSHFLLPEMPVNGLPGAAGSNGDAGRVGRFGVLVGFYFHAASSSSRRSGARVEACGPPETSTRLAAGFGVGIAYAQCAIHPSGWFPRSGPRDRIRLVQYTIIGPIWQLRMGCHCT